MTNEDVDVLTFEEVERGADEELAHVLIELMLRRVSSDIAVDKLLDLLEVGGGIGDEMRKDFVREALELREDEPNEVDGITKDDCLRHFETQCSRRDNYSRELVATCFDRLSMQNAKARRKNKP